MADAEEDRPTLVVAQRPLLPRLAGFPVAFFTATLLTDLAYAQTANLQWQYFSIWLLTGGLCVGGVAGVAALIDWRGAADRRRAGGRFVLGLVSWLLSFLNAMVHSRDGWTAVVPDGIILSATVVVLLAIRSWATGPVVLPRARAYA